MRLGATNAAWRLGSQSAASGGVTCGPGASQGHEPSHCAHFRKCAVTGVTAAVVRLR
jgi:hypothetical protein